MLMLRFTLQIYQLNITLNLFQIHTPLQPNKLVIMKWTIYCNSSTKNMMDIFWMLMSVISRLEWCFPLLQNFIQLLFHEYGGANVAVTNFMSHFYMFLPTKATVELANGNTGHSQGIGIILC